MLGLCIVRLLSEGNASGFDIDAETEDISGPLDDLYHLNRRAGAASIGSGLVTFTTRAVSSGTSCNVALVARDDKEGEPEG